MWYSSNQPWHLTIVRIFYIYHNNKYSIHNFLYFSYLDYPDKYTDFFYKLRDLWRNMDVLNESGIEIGEAWEPRPQFLYGTLLANRTAKKYILMILTEWN